MKTPKEIFGTHRCSARQRHIPFLLTFDEWWEIWQGSGHWKERGHHRGQYVMARFGDKGPYAVGNVKIILHTENISEKEWSLWARAQISAAHSGKAVSLQTREKLRACNVGRKHKKETKKKISKSLVGNKRNLGNKASLKTRAKMRKAHLGIEPFSKGRSRKYLPDGSYTFR